MMLKNTRSHDRAAHIGMGRAKTKLLACFGVMPVRGHLPLRGRGFDAHPATA